MCGWKRLGLLTVLSLAFLLPAPASAQVPALSRGSLIIGGTAGLTVDVDDRREDRTAAVFGHDTYGLAVGVSAFLF